MQKRYLKILLVVISIGWFSYQLLSSGLSGIANDSGIGWHLQYGSYILNSLSLPDSDPFLAYPKNVSVANFQWLADLVLSFTYETAGWKGLYSLAFAIIIIFVWSMMFVMSINLSRSVIFSVLMLFTVSNLTSMHFLLRPVLFQMMFFAFVFFVLLQIQQQLREEKELRLTHYLGFFVLFAIWTNFHPSFAIGIAMIALLIGSRILDALILKHRLTANEIKQHLLLIFTTIAASLVSPFGVKLHLFILEHMSVPALTVHQEWLPPIHGALSQTLLFALSFIFLSLVVLSRRKIRFIGTFPLIAPALLLVMSFQVIRYAPLAAIATFLVAAALAQHVLYKLNPILVDNDFEVELLSKVAFTTVLVIVCATSISTNMLGRHPFFTQQYGPSHSLYPYDALDWLSQQQKGKSKPIVVMNHPDWGGFITLQGYPGILPTSDDRLYLLEDNYRDAMLGLIKKPNQKDLDTLLQKPSDYLLFPKDSLVGRWIESKFTDVTVYSDNLSIVLQLHPASTI